MIVKRMESPFLKQSSMIPNQGQRSGASFLQSLTMAGMFSYDVQLLALLQTPPATVADVLAMMQSIDELTVDGDGLKWFNWLYWQVTQAVETRIQAGGFADPAFLATLDVQFAGLYFSALRDSLQNQSLPECWEVLFAQRNDIRLARIQCAMAGINAHINHDLPLAIVSTCQSRGVTPQHGSSQYNDYTNLNTNLDALIEAAKTTLNVRLPGDALPAVPHVEDTVAAWSLTAARESAWKSSEILWSFQGQAFLVNGYDKTLDGFATVIGKSLLVVAP